MNSTYRTSRVLVASMLTLAAALAAPACSTTDHGFTTNEGEFATDSGPPDVATTCGIHCSRDLKQVLDSCEGEAVKEQCNADQGCANGACVDACTSAAVNKGSPGCEFWTLPPDDDSAGGQCFAALIANTWDRAVELSADFDGAPLDISQAVYTVTRDADNAIYTKLDGPVPPGQVAVVFLSDAVGDISHAQIIHCPPGITAAYTEDPIFHGTVVTKAFHLKADAPVAAYSMFPYGGEQSKIPSATLLLPVSTWEKNYVAVSAHDFDSVRRQPRFLQLVANEDDTEVTIRPSVDIATTTNIAGTSAGNPKTYKLSRGQVLQIAQRELTGSPIEATKPIGMFGGAWCTELPDPYCDVVGQQIAPFAQWGTEYAAVPFLSRIETFNTEFHEKVPYSIVGAVDGTVLQYSPSRPLGAPETLNAGESIHFFTDQLFVVKSQDSKHPFYAAVYMTGSTYGSGMGVYTMGDPDFVNIPPSEQFLDRYVFFTDYTFPNTSLTIVRKKTSTGFKPVELECAGEITDFQPLDTEGNYEFAWVKLAEGFVLQNFERGTCNYGRQEAHSDGPFAVTVWGTGRNSSYGYVAGMGLRSINDAPPPVVK